MSGCQEINMINLRKRRNFMEVWGPVLALIVANFALIVPLFLWNRAESRADIRHMDIKLEATRELVRAIYDETRDFHNRLCSIEERNKK
jgi:hypothetical protein